jgi:hypothetical protein
MLSVRRTEVVCAWYRTDGYAEAVDALMLADEQLGLVDQLWRWKFSVIAMHSATQAFMVLALRSGTNLSVLTPTSSKKWVQAYESGGEFPTEPGGIKVNGVTAATCPTCGLTPQTIGKASAHDS